MTDPRDATLTFEAKKIKIVQDKNGHILTLAIHPSDVPEEIFRSWVGTRYQVVMVELDDEDQPVPVNAARAGERAIKTAGILCKDPNFQAWFGEEVKEFLADEEACAKALRNLLSIKSRKEFKEDHLAREEFNRIRDRYMESKQ